MAIDLEAARFLLSSTRHGVAFGNCVMLGRQHFYLSHRETRGLLREAGLDPAHYPSLFPSEYPPFAEPFLRFLGAHRIETLDYSDFEGATMVHDLNKPIPDSLRAALDVVCDLGTLEHVFHYPTAIRSCLEMVKPGGHFLAVTPANNHFGHGFYQFSPELFFRLMSPANGYQVERLFAVAYGLRRRWFAVADPAAIHRRVVMINPRPVLLFIQAKRTALLPVLENAPQQSDYAVLWNKHAVRDGLTQVGSSARTARLLLRLKRGLLETAPALVRTAENAWNFPLNPLRSFCDRSSFTPVSKRQLCRTPPS